MSVPPPNPYTKWYHCLCCMPTPESKAPPIEASPKGIWTENGFKPDSAPVTEAFKKEFEGK